jgi:hypothetical protein
MDHSRIKVSSKRRQFLNSLKRTTNLSTESLDYIKRCQIIYNRVIKEDNKREPIVMF